MAAVPGSNNSNIQWLRRVSLLMVNDTQALDLSQMHFKFSTAQCDEESPNNVSIRVYNLKDETIKAIQGEYSEVVLQAGYEQGPFGVIFKGTVKQYRIGKEGDAVNSYLDILAADGDITYNFGYSNMCMAAGSTSLQRIQAIINQNSQYVKQGDIQATGGTLPRGKVLFGLSRAKLRSEAQQQGCTWNITNGVVNVTPLTGYLPGEAVVLTAQTGLIGRVEQTPDGMRCRCLLNPKITPGNLVKIDNRSINQQIAVGSAALPGGAQQDYNKWAGQPQFLASTATDGIYRVYVAEHEGDTRGQQFYTNITALAVDPVTNKVKAYG